MTALALHRFSPDWPICQRCGASQSGAALGLESPFPGRCVHYATSFRYFRAHHRHDATGLREALEARRKITTSPEAA